MAADCAQTLFGLFGLLLGQRLSALLARLSYHVVQKPLRSRLAPRFPSVCVCLQGCALQWASGIQVMDSYTEHGNLIGYREMLMKSKRSNFLLPADVDNFERNLKDLEAKAACECVGERGCCHMG